MKDTFLGIVGMAGPPQNSKFRNPRPTVLGRPQ
jgi:hypothetical protein